LENPPLLGAGAATGPDGAPGLENPPELGGADGAGELGLEKLLDVETLGLENPPELDDTWAPLLLPPAPLASLGTAEPSMMIEAANSPKKRLLRNT